MTISNYHYYHPSSSHTINFQSIKQIETVTTTTTTYSSDESEEDDIGQSEGVEDGAEDDGNAPPLLIKDDTEKIQLMKLIVSIVASSFAQQHSCPVCSYESINKILLNLVNITRVDLKCFEKIVIMINRHSIQNQQECIKYVILGVFINHGDLSFVTWSNILKMMERSIFGLSVKYQKLQLSNEEIRNFNGKLLSLVKGSIKLI